MSIDHIKRVCEQRSLAFLDELDRLDLDGKVDLLTKTFLRVHSSEEDKRKAEGYSWVQYPDRMGQ